MYKELCLKEVKEVKEGDNNWTFHTSLTSDCARPYKIVMKGNHKLKLTYYALPK